MEQASLSHPLFPIALESPVQLDVAADRFVLSPMRWRLSKEAALLALSGELTGKGLHVEAALERLQLPSLRHIAPHLFPLFPIEGVLSTSFSLAGEWPKPYGTMDLQVEELSFGSDIALPLGMLQLQASTTLSPQQLSCQGTLSGLFSKKPLTFSGAVPLLIGEHIGDIGIDSSAAVQGAIEGAGDLTPFLELVVPDRVDLAAEGSLSLTLSGSTRNIKVSGGLAVRNGHVEDFDSGALLLGITGDVYVKDNSVVIDKIYAHDGGGGSVHGHGSLSLSHPPPLSVGSHSAALWPHLPRQCASGNQRHTNPTGRPYRTHANRNSDS